MTMSKNKSQIGHSSIARQQPPPIVPGQRWSTKPPIAGAPAVIRRTPGPPPEPVPAVVPPSLPPPRIASRQPHAAAPTKHERRAMREQSGSVDRWVATTETVGAPSASLAPRRVQASAQANPASVPPSHPNETRVLPGQFRKLIAQLQVRIDTLSELQRKRELALADPTAHQDALQWRRLLAEFEAEQAKLDELIDRREYAETQLEGLREPAERTTPPGKRIAQRPSASVVRVRLGRRVYDLRVQRGLTQEALARLAGIPGYAFPSIETGDKGAPVDTLAAIAYAFDMTISELLLGVDAATDEAARLAGVLAAQPAESQRALALVELALVVASESKP